MVPRSWSEWVASVIILLVVAICAFGAGQASRTYVIDDARREITKLTKDNQDLREKLLGQHDEMTAVAEKLAAANGNLKDAFNDYRTVVLKVNDATSISTGHFIVGLSGPPANDKVSINVNGTPHTVSAGDSIDTGVSGCRVQVQSFDSFKVTLFTSCPPTKP
jgi:hypothetical protein